MSFRRYCHFHCHCRCHRQNRVVSACPFPCLCGLRGALEIGTWGGVLSSTSRPSLPSGQWWRKHMSGLRIIWSLSILSEGCFWSLLSGDRTKYGKQWGSVWYYQSVEIRAGGSLQDRHLKCLGYFYIRLTFLPYSNYFNFDLNF